MGQGDGCAYREHPAERVDHDGDTRADEYPGRHRAGNEDSDRGAEDPDEQELGREHHQ